MALNGEWYTQPMALFLQYIILPFSENSFVSSAYSLYRSKSSKFCTLQAVATPN